MCEYQSGRDRPSYDVDAIARGMSELSQRWDNRLRFNGLDIAKDYIGGRLSLLILLDCRSQRAVNRNVPIAAEGQISEIKNDPSIGIADDEFGDPHCFDDGSQNGMFLRVVQEVESVERITLPGRKYFKGLERISDRLTGCFYSLTGGFKIDPVVSGGKVEPAILSSLVATDHFPGHMLKRRLQIVDSVGYCERDLGRRFIREIDPNNRLGGVRIMLGGNNMRVSVRVVEQMPFKIANVMIGPLDL